MNSLMLDWVGILDTYVSGGRLPRPIITNNDSNFKICKRLDLEFAEG